ncbi:MAG: cadmium-translocating P-type ATPase, partial [Clostridia bacterium]|nr:cadmium-translocating P-type ATPase [Clostridia bacterium]
VGELFQSYAVGRSRRAIGELMDIRPEYANIERDGLINKVNPEAVSIGDIIIVKPGERIPLDGIITEGHSSLNTSALTGESLPREVAVGDVAVSGCINQSGVLKIQVTKECHESTVAKILDLVENAGAKKARTESFITRFARYYTPIVVISALLLALVPPLLLDESFKMWVHRAFIFLVVSCPCALVISVPLSFFGGIGAASKNGILIKGSNYLEMLAKADTVVFDKTGTLTEGSFSVTDVFPASGYNKEKLLEYAALAESYSDHPISLSLLTAYAKEPDKSRVQNVRELAGLGICATIDGQTLYAGNRSLMERIAIRPPEVQETGTQIHLALNQAYMGYILISDTIRPTSKKTIERLKVCGICKTVMLTGDTNRTAQIVAEQTAIDEWYAGLLPQDKVALLEKLMNKTSKTGTVLFVGDGMNDAPALSRADAGLAMGGLGSDAAIEAADVVLMDDDPAKIPLAITIARKTLRIARQNIAFSIGVKALILLLGAFGITGMWEAVFADVGVAVIAILNASRTLRIK